MRTLAWMARNTKLAGGKSPVESELRRRLVLIEQGAEGIEAVLRDGSFDETLVIAAAPADAPHELGLNAAARVAALESQKRMCCAATIVLAGDGGSQTLAARELAARMLLAHLQAAGGGELVLSAPLLGDRDALLALVEKLLGDLETRAVTIRLQFPSEKKRREFSPRSALDSPTSAAP